MWLTSHDDEFRNKRDDVLHLYYDAPTTSTSSASTKRPASRRWSALPRPADGPGPVVRREFEYIRHGTLCLMGAFDVRRGKLFGFTCPGHSGATFVELLDIIDACYPKGRGHIVCDNLSAHDTDDVLDWFEEHPRWTRSHGRAVSFDQSHQTLVATPEREPSGRSVARVALVSPQDRDSAW